MIQNCKMRHENGNCLPAGGFCTANKNICKALQNAYEMGQRDVIRKMGEEKKMDDLIKRQDAIEVLSVMQGIVTEYGVRKGISMAWQQIKNLPSAHPERKKGKWIDQDEGAFYPVECSECSKIPLFDAYGDYILSDFCPNCGAKMLEDVENM